MAELKNTIENKNAAIATAPGDIPLPMVQERIAALAYQFRHDNTIRPFAPQPGESVEIWASSGVEMPLDRAEVWFTTNGRLPDASSHKMPMTVEIVDWEAGAGYLNRWHAVLPGQLGGTAVRYKIAGPLMPRPIFLPTTARAFGTRWTTRRASKPSPTTWSQTSPSGQIGCTRR